MSNEQPAGDREEGVELQLPPVDEALAAGTSATIITPSQYELAVMIRDATVTFLALPAAEQTEERMLALTVEAAAAHGYPNVEARLDHMPTQADVDELNAYIAELEQQQAAESDADSPAT